MPQETSKHPRTTRRPSDSPLPSERENEAPMPGFLNFHIYQPPGFSARPQGHCWVCVKPATFKVRDGYEFCDEHKHLVETNGEAEGQDDPDPEL